MRYKRREQIADAVQWHEHGDHTKVKRISVPYLNACPYYCPCCSVQLKADWGSAINSNHGFIEGILVCPGDWILEFADGHFEKRTDEDFKAQFEAVLKAGASKCPLIPSRDRCKKCRVKEADDGQET